MSRLGKLTNANEVPAARLSQQNIAGVNIYRYRMMNRLVSNLLQVKTAEVSFMLHRQMKEVSMEFIPDHKHVVMQCHLSGAKASKT